MPCWQTNPKWDIQLNPLLKKKNVADGPSTAASPLMFFKVKRARKRAARVDSVSTKAAARADICSDDTSIVAAMVFFFVVVVPFPSFLAYTPRIH